VSELHEAWAGLTQRGHLLGVKELDALPAPRPPAQDLADRLRSALAALPEDEPTEGAPFSTLLDLALERMLGLHAGWRKGSDVGAVDAQKLKSSMTLFARAAPDQPVFRDVLAMYFDGAEDQATLQQL